VNFPDRLNKKFPGQRRVPLGSLVQQLRYGVNIPKGTFVVMASGDRKVRAKILEKDTAHRGFSLPLPLNTAASDLKITPNYLLWFFSHNFVADHLLSHATGSVFLRVPKNVLLELPIPIPRGVAKRLVGKEIVMAKTNDEFGVQLAAFYGDYVLNVHNARYHTALILAGAMAEMIVYQSLIDQGVDRKLLEKDRNLGMGKMLTYLGLLKLEKDVPFKHLRELQKKRNAAVHAGRLAGSKVRFGKSDLSCFDHIVQYYGI